MQVKVQHGRGAMQAHDLAFVTSPNGCAQLAREFTKAAGAAAAYLMLRSIAEGLLGAALPSSPQLVLEDIGHRLMDARELTPRTASRAWASAYEGALESLMIAIGERDDVFRGLFAPAGA